MRRNWAFGLGLLAVLVLVVVLVGRGERDDGEALSPTGTDPDGAKAMVDLLEELGSQVEPEAGSPAPDATVAVLLEDRLDDTRRRDLAEWIRGGGTLVVADPISPLTPALADPTAAMGGLLEGPIERDHCDVVALDAVDSVFPGNGVRFRVPPGSGSCFGDGDEAYVVVTDTGAGTIVAVGGAEPFTNESLAVEDDAVLVADLVAPRPPERVAFLVPAPVAPGEGEDELADLVPLRVEQAVLQLGIAFLAYVWFRARRAGRPVLEPLPTRLAGSELVAAVGQLLSLRRDPGAAATELRADLRRQLGHRIGLAPDADLQALVDAAARAGADPDRVRRALDPARPVADDAALVRLAQEIEAVRSEVLHVQPRQ